MAHMDCSMDRARDTQSKKVSSKGKRGIHLQRYFTTPGVDPADEIAWELRTAVISGEDGKVVFEQKDVEIPKSWSMLATNVVASKYFRGQIGTDGRERSVRRLVGRVVDTIHAWGKKQNYFASEADAETFHAELSHLLLRQKAAFNSPVWFNVGVEKEPQCSACFINSVQELDGQHPEARPHRGHALQIRLGHGDQPLQRPLGEGEALRRR